MQFFSFFDTKLDFIALPTASTVGIRSSTNHFGHIFMPRTASLNSIEKKIRELQAKAEALKNQEKPGIKQLKILLRKYKLDIHDVKLALGTNAEKTSRLKGRKIAPKYRNPNNKKETWSGRGRQPLWVVAALKQGKKIEDLAI